MIITIKTQDLTLGELRKLVQAADEAGLSDSAEVDTYEADVISVSAEPQRVPLKNSPHSRACGIATHDHGLACSNDCPTCHGRAQGYYESPFNADQ